MRNIKFDKGEIILKEGSPGNEAYVINSGKIEVIKTVNSIEVVLAILSEGQIFGEMSLIDEAPRSATIRTLESTDVTIINREEFNELFYTNPEILSIFLKNIFERLRNIDQAVISLTVKKTAAGYASGKAFLSGLTPETKSALNNKEIELNKFPYKIGRKTDNFYKDLFSNNDLYITDEIPYNISRNHLSIQYYKENLLVIDRGSTLGTIVNNIKIGANYESKEIELKKGSENIVIIGPHNSPFKFMLRIP